MTECNQCANLINVNDSIKCTLCNSVYHAICIPGLNIIDLPYLRTTDWICINCLKEALPYVMLDDEADLIATNSTNNEIQNRTISQLNNMIFNPFTLDDYDNSLDILNCDPDLNFFCNSSLLRGISACSYYSETSFKQKHNGIVWR